MIPREGVESLNEGRDQANGLEREGVIPREGVESDRRGALQDRVPRRVRDVIPREGVESPERSETCLRIDLPSSDPERGS